MRPYVWALPKRTDEEARHIRGANMNLRVDIPHLEADVCAAEHKIIDSTSSMQKGVCSLHCSMCGISYYQVHKLFINKYPSQVQAIYYEEAMGGYEVVQHTVQAAERHMTSIWQVACSFEHKLQSQATPKGQHIKISCVSILCGLVQSRGKIPGSSNQPDTFLLCM